VLIAAGMLIGIAPAMAEDNNNIGAANIVHNQVAGNLPTGTVKIIQGDAVFSDEGVQTDASSSAKLILRDNTNITVGPNSSVKLDRFVYSGPAQAGAIVVNLAKGTFRFATGNAEKQAYTINTPTATLGVRGTTLYFLVSPPGQASKVIQSLPGLKPNTWNIEANSTIVTLGPGHGGAQICARAGNKNCVEITQPYVPYLVNAQSVSVDSSRTDLMKSMFLGNLVTTYIGGPSLSKEVRNLLMSDPTLLDALIDAADDGNDAQQGAIGAGLAQAASDLASSDPQLAQAIQGDVAQNGPSGLTTAFASTGTQTASTGGAGGGGGGGGGRGQVGGVASSGGNGGTNSGGSSSGGGSNGSSFGTPNSFTGFTNFSSSGGGGTTTAQTNSASPAVNAP
jgi:hypothetical protein